MAEALPQPIAFHQPSSKPLLPGSLSQLDVTPEKPHHQELKVRNSKSNSRRRVAFADKVKEILEVNEVIDCQQYACLDKPQLNSTYVVKKQLEKLRIDQQRQEKDLKQIILQEDTQLNPINEKATAALNYKRKDEKYQDLLPVDVDFERELEKAASKRTTYEAPTATHDNPDLNDIMAFWTPDLITDNPKLDFDKDIDPAILEPDVAVDTLDYLTDLYFCKDISSQFR